MNGSTFIENCSGLYRNYAICICMILGEHGDLKTDFATPAFENKTIEVTEYKVSSHLFSVQN